jgi:DNA-binding NarL/FixJ family response regulator
VRTILIVDDDAHFRSLARRLLEADGFEVVGEACDGASGLAAAGSLRPEVVLLDVGLPDLDGFEVARMLAGNQTAASVIMTSSRDARAYGRRISNAGNISFLPKERISGAAIRALLERP